MLGVDLDAGHPAPELARRALLEQRLVLNATGPATIRLEPPLVVGEQEIDEALSDSGRIGLMNDSSAPRTSSYEADPESVKRVLLLFSGGLDTSVMLKWIQERYDAEVVALTVNLGQPGEDFETVRAKALHLGAVECHVVDAREEFAHEYVAPAIKANAIYGLGYPLFTALGRPLIAKLAVDYARGAGATRSPTGAPARATTRYGSRPRSSRSRPS